MVVVSPHQYEANLRLVRAMTDDLADVTTVEGLIDVYEHRADRLAAAVGRSEVAAPSEVVAPLLMDAAFLGRYREIPAERQQADAAHRIAKAGNGPTWVTLAETGDDGPDAATGFQRVEMRVPDGLGMHTYVDIDASTFLPLYGVEFLQLDPTTGEHVEGQPRPERKAFTDRQEWLTVIAGVKEA